MRLRGKQLDAINAAIKTGDPKAFEDALQKTCEQAASIGQPPSARSKAVLEAAINMDWMQVVLNQGPPCFHLQDDCRFCGRSKRWQGHDSDGRIHAFVSLADLIIQVDNKL